MMEILLVKWVLEERQQLMAVIFIAFLLSKMEKKSYKLN